jgi:hypothetical protein
VDLKVFPARSRQARGPGGGGAVMTATLDGVASKKPEPTAEAGEARELVRLAGSRGCP